MALDRNGNPVADTNLPTGAGNNTNTGATAPVTGPAPVDPNAGTPYSDPNYGNTLLDRGGDAEPHTDSRDFMYGRDPNYATDTAAAERATSGANAASLTAQGTAAVQTGTQLGNEEGNLGVNAAGNISSLAGNTIAAGANDATRTGAQADYRPATQALYQAQAGASQLSAFDATQGPSAAQAQLQSGLNQSQNSALALARSGRGWGGSASALTAATGQNAAAAQSATDASAQLSAQENQAWRAQQSSNLAQAAGINTTAASQYGTEALSQAQLQQQTTAENDSAQQALNQQGLTAYGAAGQLGLSSLQADYGAQEAGQTLGMQGTQAAQAAYGQGETMAGINESSQQQGDLARESDLLQGRAINAGISANAQAQNSALWGTIGSIGGAVIGTAVGGPGGGAVGAAGGGAAGSAIGSDEDLKTDIEPLDGGPSTLALAQGASNAAAAANTGSAAAGAANAFTSGREGAAKTANGVATSDAALQSDITSLANAVNTGRKAYQATLNTEPGRLQQFESMAPAQPAYGMQSSSTWQPMAVTSDEDEKSGIHPSAALDMVDEAPGYSYYYKDPEQYGDGQKFGPMAQDLQKTPAGRSTVLTKPDGTLMVDTGRLALAQHAAMHSMRQDNAQQFAALRDDIDALKKKAPSKTDQRLASDMAAAEAANMQALQPRAAMGAAQQQNEVTPLPPEKEAAFRQWLSANHVSDLDDPDSHYDYRGAFLGGVGRGASTGHFVDTYKQHGHPTFSDESQYSQNANDGGSWDGDTFLPAVNPRAPDYAALDAAYRRAQ